MGTPAEALAVGLKWTWRASGWAGRRWVGPTGSTQIIFHAKTIPVKARNCLKALKILRKSQTFQENSQRRIGTRTIQINWLVLMKKILEPSNKFQKSPENSQKIFGQHLNTFLKAFALKKHQDASP
jgi:hypothetical protein